MNIKMSWLDKTTANNSTQFQLQELPFEWMYKLTRACNYSGIEWEGGKRKAANFRACHALVLDIDGTWTIAEAMAEFENTVNVFLATTKSHLLPNKTTENGALGKAITPKHHFRIIIGLETPITDSEIYKTVIKNLINKYKGDQACKDLARMYYGNPNQLVWFSTQSNTNLLTMEMPTNVAQ